MRSAKEAKPPSSASERKAASAPSAGDSDRQQGSALEQAPLVEEITEALSKVVGKDEATKATEAVIHVIQTREEHYSGHIPPPAHLHEIEAIIPGGVDRILRMAEVDLARIDYCDREMTKAYSRNSLLGLIFGFIVAILLILGAIICVFYGYEKVAIGLVGATALGLVAGFLNAWKKSPAQETSPAAQTNQRGGSQSRRR